MRFDPGLEGRGLSLTMTPSLGSASQGANRLWGMQEPGAGWCRTGRAVRRGWAVRGRRRLRDVGAGRPGHGDAVCGHGVVGDGLPGAALGMALDLGPAVRGRVEGAQQGGFGGALNGLGGGAPALGGDAAHSVQVWGGVTF